MIERFVELRKTVNGILDDFPSAPPAVTAAELEILKELITVLRPLEGATKDLCGQKYVTASMVIPLINGLQRDFENLVLEHEVALVLKDNLLKEISRRFGLMESCHFFAIATILDPRFKKVVFKQPTDCTRALGQINRLFQEKNNNSAEQEPDTDGDTNNEPEESKEKSSLRKFHSDCVQNAKRARRDIPDNIALKYLTVVATSVPSERLFSKTGILMNDKRNRLEGSKLHKQLFLGAVDEALWMIKAVNDTNKIRQSRKKVASYLVQSPVIDSTYFD
ncbi:uncharacterized protein LOC127291369 [Leptopilina boulardi]|uniref:uncharacterized protein LOC127291369 n=1 Tax=Leptopilina boulardi TaxID=63433 RepID=UPI0021F5A5D3|nr:uncharacterized protein LOC127291369 [Leptopilina boulardi]